MTILEGFMTICVLACGLLVLYHHILFPVYLKRLAARTADLAEFRVQGDLPTITIVVAAYNEAPAIADKIRNLAALLYLPEKLSVMIQCDGCTDETVARIARTMLEPECRDLALTVCRHDRNRGKVAVLNEALAELDAEIVCLTDVTAWMSLDALQRAAHHFQQVDVGVVAGTYHLLQTGSEGEDTYWRYQRVIKQGEAALGAPLGVHGACYFMRRTAISPLPADTINDDFILPMSAVAKSYRAIYDSKIIGLETEPSDQEMDYKRRCRIAAGNAQQVMRLVSLMHPRHGGIALAFLSGKVLRVAMPYLMVLCLVGSALLAVSSPTFLFLFALQAAAYALAAARAAGFLVSGGRLLKLLHYLVAGHVASLRGSLRYFFGLEKGRWSKVETRQTIENAP